MADEMHDPGQIAEREEPRSPVVGSADRPQRTVATADWHWSAAVVIGGIASAAFWALPESTVLVKSVVMTVWVAALAWLIVTCPYVRSPRVRMASAVLAFFVLEIFFLSQIEAAEVKRQHAEDLQQKTQEAARRVAPAFYWGYPRSPYCAPHLICVYNNGTTELTIEGVQFDGFGREPMKPVTLAPNEAYHLPADFVEQSMHASLSATELRERPLNWFLANALGEKYIANTTITARLVNGTMVMEIQQNAVERVGEQHR